MSSAVVSMANELFVRKLNDLYDEADCREDYIHNALMRGKVRFTEEGLKITKETTLREVINVFPELAEELPPLDPDGSGRLLHPRKKPEDASGDMEPGGEYEDPFGVKLRFVKPKLYDERTLKYAVDHELL